MLEDCFPEKKSHITRSLPFRWGASCFPAQTFRVQLVLVNCFSAVLPAEVQGTSNGFERAQFFAGKRFDSKFHFRGIKGKRPTGAGKFQVVEAKDPEGGAGAAGGGSEFFLRRKKWRTLQVADIVFVNIDHNAIIDEVFVLKRDCALSPLSVGK